MYVYAVIWPPLEHFQGQEMVYLLYLYSILLLRLSSYLLKKCLIATKESDNINQIHIPTDLWNLSASF